MWPIAASTGVPLTRGTGHCTLPGRAARASIAAPWALPIAAIAAAGMAAGAINTLVGSGTLITFPVLLAFGYSPVTANVSNTIGLVPGSLAGGISGAVLLLVLASVRVRGDRPGLHRDRPRLDRAPAAPRPARPRAPAA